MIPGITDKEFEIIKNILNTMENFMPMVRVSKVIFLTFLIWIY